MHDDADAESPRHLTHPLVIEAVVEARMHADRAETSVFATFRYDPADPLAVMFEFGEPGTGVCSWLLGREQLREGLSRGFHAPTLSVEVSGGRSAGEAPTPARLRLTVRGLEARAVVEMDAEPVRNWLAATFFAIEAGAEGSELDWDGFVSGLTSGSA